MPYRDRRAPFALLAAVAASSASPLQPLGAGALAAGASSSASALQPLDPGAAAATRTTPPLGPGGCPSAGGARPCSGHGSCRGGRCVCDRGWGEPTCARAEYLLACPSNCSWHAAPPLSGGACVGGRCVCAAGRSGDDCADVTNVSCEPGCSGHGECLDGRCACVPGYYGDACAQGCAGYVPATQKPCSGRGLCAPTGSPGRSPDRCRCFVGFEGDGCERDVEGVASCARDCSGRGSCRHGRCTCDARFAGHDCSIELRHGRLVHALDSRLARALAALVVFAATAGCAGLMYRYAEDVHYNLATPMQVLGIDPVAPARRKGGA